MGLLIPVSQLVRLLVCYCVSDISLITVVLVIHYLMSFIPIWSMYDIYLPTFTIKKINQIYIGRYIIRGSYGSWLLLQHPVTSQALLDLTGCPTESIDFDEWLDVESMAAFTRLQLLLVEEMQPTSWGWYSLSVCLIPNSSNIPREHTSRFLLQHLARVWNSNLMGKCWYTLHWS